MELFRWVLVVAGVLLVLLTVYECKRGKVSRVGLIFWTTLWVVISISAAYPPLYDSIVMFLQVGLPVHFVTICAIVILFLFVHRLYVKISELDRKLTKVVQQIALHDADEKKERPK
jgi:hypothetical protein